MLASLRCGLSGHRINRRRVWNDGTHFRTECDRCGTPLIRDLKGWRPVQDSDETVDETADA